LCIDKSFCFSVNLYRTKRFLIFHREKKMPSKVGSILVGQKKLGVLSNGNFVVAYGSGTSYYAQVMSSTGELVGSAFSSSVFPTITLLPNGNFLLLYANGSNSYVQVVSADGALLGSPVATGATITVLPNSYFVVVAQNGALGYSTQVVDVNGALSGGAVPFTAVPTITPLSNSSFVAMYQSVGNYKVQVVSSGGSLLGTATAFGTAQPNITTLPSGNFVVSYGSVGNYLVQFVNGSGVLVGAAIQSGVPQSVTVLLSGNFVVSYGSGTSYSAQFVNGSGVLVGTAIQSIGLPIVTALLNGNFVVVYFANSQYHVNFFSATGGYVGAASGTVLLYTPTLIPLANGYVAAYGYYSSISSYYLQLLNSSGAAIGATILLGASPPSFNALPNGNSLVSYQNGTSYYTKVLATTGTFVGSTLQSTNSVGITLFSNGNFVATYSAGTNYYAQVMSQAGVLMGNAIQLGAYPPNVTPLPNGNFLLSYQSGTGYYGQLFNVNATAISSAFQLTGISSPGSADLLSDDYALLSWGAGANTQLQVFYVGSNLTLVNANQPLNYSQDGRSELGQINILTEYNTATAMLTLSDPQAGTLTTPTFGNSTATFSTQTGIWQAFGDVNDVNTLLNMTQFVPTPNYKENFTVSVAVVDEGDRNATGLLAMVGVPTAPVLKNNNLNITEGQRVILTNSNLQVSPIARPVTYTMSNLKGASFELVSDPGKAITQFTQQQIDNQQIVIISNRTAPVSYEVSLSDGVFTLPTVLANVTFINHAPVVVNAPSAQVVNVDQPFSFALMANQTFMEPDGDPMTYSAQLSDGSPLSNNIQLNTSDSSQLVFTGIFSKPSSLQLTLFARDPLNATAQTPLQIIAQSGGGSTTNNNTSALAQIVAPVGAAVGMAALAGLAFAFFQYSKNKESRKDKPLANLLRDALRLKGVDNFYDSENGRQYVDAVQLLETELQKQGIDCAQMEAQDLKNLSVAIARTAHNKITPATDCFGNTVITATDLKNHASNIAIGVQQYRALPVNGDEKISCFAS
jgi:hypothetical protein